MTGDAARAVAATLVLGAIGAAVAFAEGRRTHDEGARCGAGFVARGPRCLVQGQDGGGSCPSPLEWTAHGCDAPERQISIAAAAVALGPSDWEAEGRVPPRWIRVQPFRLDAFEVTRGRWSGGDGHGHGRGRAIETDAARAASAISRDEAAGFCASHGGRLPTEDEWIVAAVSGANPPRRYPWGDTGAVCRRAAWGLESGPCAVSGDGSDTVGAHPDGDSPLGLHDVAGNVAEWVAPEAARPDIGIAKGGSWASALATDLRVWARLELPPDAHDPRAGFRCAYPP